MIIFTFFTILMYIVIGTAILRVAFKKEGFLFCLSYSLLIAIVLMNLFSLLRIIFSIDVGLYFTPLLIALSILILIKEKFRLKKIGLSVVSTLFAGGIVFNILYVFLQTQIRPLIAYDAIASWFLVGKEFYINSSFNPSFYHIVNFNFPPVYYLSLADLAVNSGLFNENGLLLLPAFVYGFIMLLSFFSLRKVYGNTFSLFLTFLISSTPHLLRHGGLYDAGYADLFLSYLILSAGTLLVYFYKTKLVSVFILFQISIVLIALTKNEGIILYFLFQLLSIGVVAITMKTKQYIYYVSAIIVGIPILVWINFASHNLPGLYRLAGSEIAFSHFFDAIGRMIAELFNIKRWSIAWLLIIASLPLFYRKGIILFILLALLVLQGIYLYTYLVSPTSVGVVEDVNGSYDRLLLQVFPLVIILTMWVFSPQCKALYSSSNKNNG